MTQLPIPEFDNNREFFIDERSFAMVFMSDFRDDDKRRFLLFPFADDPYVRFWDDKINSWSDTIGEVPKDIKVLFVASFPQNEPFCAKKVCDARVLFDEEMMIENHAENEGGPDGPGVLMVSTKDGGKALLSLQIKSTKYYGGLNLGDFFTNIALWVSMHPPSWVNIKGAE